MIERKIIIGLIVSTDYIRALRPIWNPLLLESSTARLISRWAMDFYDEYKKPVGAELETIFYKKVQEGLDEELAEEIEEDILPDLSEEFVRNNFDSSSFIVESVKYLNARHFQQHSDQINNILNGKGALEDKLKEVAEKHKEFKPLELYKDSSLDLSKEEVLEALDKAFASVGDPVVSFPKELGEFWDDKFVPGGFISFLAPEKRGKTYRLLDIGMRAVKQKRNVAFFQAGDMNEGEQLKRIVMYESKRNVLEKYCGEHFQPIRDCKKNQDDTCSKEERECDFSPFDDDMIDNLDKLTKQDLIEAYEMSPEYKPCWNCEEYRTKKLGAPWIKKVEEVNPIEVDEAKELIKNSFIKNNKRFKLSTHPNGTLSVDDMIDILDSWEENDDFIPDIILVDYWELLAAQGTDERTRQNNIGKDLRRLSQIERGGKLPLVIAPTQANSLSYKSRRLKLDNFSEDKRKYGHVTAMYGLNQDPDGREKGLGLMIINEIIMREGDFDIGNEVTVLQDLWQGRPCIGSYFN